MKILLFGKNGQLGWELQRSLAPLGDLVALGSRDAACAAEYQAAKEPDDPVRHLRPDVIVNAAA